MIRLVMCSLYKNVLSLQYVQEETLFKTHDNRTHSVVPEFSTS